MVTKDQEMILHHDNAPRRTTYIPVSGDPAPVVPSNTYTAGLTAQFINQDFNTLNYNLSTTLPDPITGVMTTYPPISKLALLDRYGTKTAETLKRLEDALQIVNSNHNIVLKIDCKNVDKDQDFFLNSLMLIVQKCVLYNVISRCIFTIVNKGDKVKDPNNYVCPLPTQVQNYFNTHSTVSGLYNDFTNYGNINVVVNQVDANTVDYIKAWGALPSVVSFEYANTSSANKDLFLEPNSGLNNLNVLQYVYQTLHKKASVFVVSPGDARGIPADNAKNTIYSFGDLPPYDYRGSLDFQYQINQKYGQIGSMTFDRPSMGIYILTNMGKLNPNYLFH